MDTKQPEALRIAEERLRALHAANERLRTCNKDAQYEIANLQARVRELGKAARDVNSRRVQELEAQLAAVGAGGVEPLRKRCLHQISEPAQAQPVDLEPVAAQSRFLTEKGWGTCTLEHHLYVKANPADWPGYETRALYAAPQPAAPAQAATAKQSPHPEYDKGFSDGWNRCEERQAAAPVGMEPVYQIGQPFPFDPENTWRDASKDAYDVCIPSKRRIIYAAAQVQAMLAAVPRNAPLYSPDDVAFPVQRSAEGVDVPPELASTARPTSTAAAEVAAQAGWRDGCSPDNCGGCVTPAAPANEALKNAALPWPWKTDAEVLDDAISAIEGQNRLKAALRSIAARTTPAASPAQAGEYPPLVCDYCGALTPDPWHSSGMLHGKMSKHIHSCDSCAVEAEVQKQDEALIWLMLVALEHHTQQTRPIARTDDAITAALLRLNGKP